MQKNSIFVVEDDRTTASVIKLYLESFNYKVAGLESNSHKAIQKIEETQPDLVLMDINLGKGMDGVDVANAICSNHNIPFIFITALDDEETIHRAALVEPAGYINKPLREKDLKTTIRLALEKAEKKEKPTPANTDPIIEELLQTTYNLSPAEARVAAKLLIHLELNAAAESLNISPFTAKKHLQRIFKKTDTNRQSALVHKIILGPVGKFLSRT